MRAKDYIEEIIKALMLVGMVAYLFFDSVFGILPACIIGIPFFISNIRLKKEKIKEKKSQEFVNMLEALSNNLNAGYSLETAFAHVYYDMEAGSTTVMKEEMRAVLNGLKVNRDFSDLIREFSIRLEVREARDFAEQIILARNYGGNLLKIIRQTTKVIADKKRIDTEIQTITAAKRLESIIMLSMPFAIMAYMRLVNEDYINIMYETLAGRLVMLASLVGITAAGAVSGKIMKKTKEI